MVVKALYVFNSKYVLFGLLFWRFFFKCFCHFLTFTPLLFCPLSPGIAALFGLLSSAGEEMQPGLAVLLCEILTAVFLSLFVHGMATHSSNELFRIVAHPLNGKLWRTVFGGGARIAIMDKPSSPARTPPPSDCFVMAHFQGEVLVREVSL